MSNCQNHQREMEEAHVVYLNMNVTKLAIDATRLLSEFNQSWGLLEASFVTGTSYC